MSRSTTVKDAEGYRVTTEWHWAGQRRRYGDSEYDATLTVADAATGEPATVDLPTIKRLAAVAMNYGNEILDRNESDRWHLPFFTSVSRVDDHSWRVRYTSLYTD